jgi:DNA-binding response OmpR family regulator
MWRSSHNRPRLLVISKDSQVRNDLVILLSGCGYFVDYVVNRSEGIAKYRSFKHAVVIMDVHALPRFPKRMLRLFRVYKKNPIILIVARTEDAHQVYPFMRLGVFDVITLPFQADHLYIVLKRLVEHSRLLAQHEFIRRFITVLLITLPVWGIFLWFCARHFYR